MDVNTLDDTDLQHLRAAIALSRQAKAKGNGPYGAVVVGTDGRVLVEAQNDQRSSGDCTGHAEMNAIRLASPLGPRALAGATIRIGEKESVTDPGGGFRFTGLPSVPQPVVLLSGYTLLDWDHPERFERGGWGPMRVRLASAASLRLRLVDASGTGVEGAQVSVQLDPCESAVLAVARSFGGNPQRGGTTDARGELNSEHVAAGTDKEHVRPASREAEY